MPEQRYEVVIVGSGPAGLAAAAQARAAGLPYVVLERATHLADTVHCYQKRKHVMAEPGAVPLRGGVPFAAGWGEAVIGGWSGFAATAGLDIRFGQEMTALERGAEGFVVRTPTASYPAANVILALRPQGNPRR